MDRADLIAALEKAEGPSEELDVQITAVLNKAIVRRYPPTDDFGPKDRWQFFSRDGEHFLGNEHRFKVLEYTRSLDAALTLVPKGMAWRIEPAIPSDTRWGRYRAGVTTWDKPYDLLCYGPTPAIALCIAALRATDCA